MKFTLAALGLLLIAVPAVAHRTHRAELGTNPVSRVVKLLLGLQQKLQAESDKEEEIFGRYHCWHKTVKEAKTASNAAAASRISQLESYVADIEAGKIEFTTERADLTKQVAGLKQDLETAEALREKEKADFEAAEEELEKGISALEAAIETLEGDGRSPSSLLSKGKLSTNAGRQNLLMALSLGRELLSASDARFFRRVIDGDVPNKDWKKLNRKATFKDTYKKRSGDIVGTLKKVKLQFTTNLADAQSTEEKAAAAYEALRSSKASMLETAEAALEALVEENGARGMSKEESQSEINDLQEQVAADEGFLQTVDSDYSAKEAEFNHRKELRSKELSAISEAVQVLHSDEARDTFKKSYSSQGYLFLQEAQAVNHVRAASAQALRSLAASTRDVRVISLLQKLAAGTGDWKKTVVEQIDNLVATLKEEEGTDLKNKETCESDRADAVRQARVLSQTIDDHTDDVTRAEDKVKEIEEQIEEQEKVKEELEATKQELKRQREDEAAHNAKAKQEDVNAVALIEEAMRIIETMQQEVHGASLLEAPHQTPAHLQGREHLAAITATRRERRHGLAHSTRAMRALAAFRAAGGSTEEPVEVEAGVAPPPPPATWEDPTYGGAAGESQGVMGLLTLIKEDVEGDIAAADSAEAEAVAAYEKQMTETSDAIAAADESISNLNGEKADHESAKVESESQRESTKGQLSATMEQIKSMEPGCDFLLVNFATRNGKRLTEIDGLEKAKAIIQGANFD